MKTSLLLAIAILSSNALAAPAAKPKSIVGGWTAMRPSSPEPETPSEETKEKPAIANRYSQAVAKLGPDTLAYESLFINRAGVVTSVTPLSMVVEDFGRGFQYENMGITNDGRVIKGILYSALSESAPSIAYPVSIAPNGQLVGYVKVTAERPYSGAVAWDKADDKAVLAQIRKNLAAKRLVDTYKASVVRELNKGTYTFSSFVVGDKKMYRAKDLELYFGGASLKQPFTSVSFNQNGTVFLTTKGHKSPLVASFEINAYITKENASLSISEIATVSPDETLDLEGESNFKFPGSTETQNPGSTETVSTIEYDLAVDPKAQTLTLSATVEHEGQSNTYQMIYERK